MFSLRSISSLRALRPLCSQISRSFSSGTGAVSAEQLAAFQAQGFLVLPNFVAAEKVDALRKRCGEILDSFDVSNSTIFSTKNDNEAHKADHYFLTSGDKIRCFFEEGAFTNGKLTRDKNTAINKMGHAMHDLDPVFADFSYQPNVCNLVNSLSPANTPQLCVQSMYIFKQPGIGGEVGAHQDSTFVISEPDTTLGLWFALEDATLENGCLWGIPGSHKYEVSRRMTRNAANTGTEFDKRLHAYDEALFVPLEVTKGSLIVFTGRFVHMSLENKSPKSRHAYTLHTISSTSTWPASNWLQRPSLPFRTMDPAHIVPVKPEGPIH